MTILPIPLSSLNSSTDNFDRLCDLADMYESGKVAGGMNRDELIKYLKNNLDIRVEISKGVRSDQVLCVKLLLEDHLISITAVPIKDTKK